MRVYELVDILKNFSYAVNCDGDRCRTCPLNKPYNLTEGTICNVLFEIEQLLKEKEENAI